MRRYTRKFLVEAINKDAVIGSTSTKKKIYNNAAHKSHAEFDEKDHKEAYALHKKLEKKATDSDEKKYHQIHGKVHRRMAVEVSVGL